MKQFRTLFASAILATGVIAPYSFAQDAPPPERSDRGSDRGGRGSFDPAQFKEQMVERFKEQLAPASDDEWNIIKPKLDKVLTTRFEQMAGGMRMSGAFGRSPGGDRGGNNGGDRQEREPRNESERAAKELSDALKNKDTSPDVITAKLGALREAKAKAAEAVKASQEDLKSVLTARQEAVLVVNGMLE